MPYKSDLEAAHARIAVLEEKLKKARRKKVPVWKMLMAFFGKRITDRKSAYFAISIAFLSICLISLSTAKMWSNSIRKATAYNFCKSFHCAKGKARVSYMDDEKGYYCRCVRKSYRKDGMLRLSLPNR